MQNWYYLFTKSTGLTIYAWVIFCFLPFYFVIRTSSSTEIIIGIALIALFFLTYRLAFVKKGWTVYVSIVIEMIISIGMTLYFGYVYFSLFLAFFIGNVQQKSGFITLYVVHLVTIVVSIILGFFTHEQIFLSQLPFIIISFIGVILLPFSMYNRNKREKLEKQLEDANKRISQLMVIEERERIARDLHDTLGQKLSLIGLKSDLAGKLIEKQPARAKKEVRDIQQTARTALKEVREMVSTMKSTKLKDEIIRVRQMIEAAEMTLKIEGKPNIDSIPLFVEHVLSMCLKEAVTNVVKHSKATFCEVQFMQSPSEIIINVMDNGIGIPETTDSFIGNGISGIKERLEFVNGSLEIDSSNGTAVTIKVPRV
ncbi:sensor histidine kinase [Perspicuibacillus lycopersici]|uniref:sensor histidine kinase n=1 Tax=Perspicuibacillus lycopersici TaxID=1325689 RepID=UPI0029552481|nr:sensor histidine kinase [Perspicuibacillus lycopersici]